MNGKGFIGSGLLLAIMLPSLLLTGCSREQLYSGMHHALQSREEVVHPSDEPIPPARQSYESYRHERAERLGRDTEQAE